MLRFSRYAAAALFALVAAFFLGGSLVAADRPSADSEKALKQRVTAFYTLLSQKKFRAAEEYIAARSKEEYYTDQKPIILGFKVGGISWEDNFRKANVTIVATSLIHTVRAGDFKSTVPVPTFWLLENGKWCWYIPPVEIKQTPFGPMKVDRAAAADNTLTQTDISNRIAHGVNLDAILKAVKADHSTVKLEKPGDSSAVIIANTLPGEVTLTSQITGGTGFEAVLEQTELKSVGKTRLVITRLRGADFKPGMVAVLVGQTSQILQIAVN